VEFRVLKVDQHFVFLSPSTQMIVTLGPTWWKVIRLLGLRYPSAETNGQDGRTDREALRAPLPLVVPTCKSA
jgi:hypothetical protein